MRNINDKLLASATLISTGNSSGSGFLLYSNEKQFLVTARHVLFDETNGFATVSREIEILCPSTEVDDLTARRIRISMANAKYSYSDRADVAVVLLGSASRIPETSSFKGRYIDYVEVIDKSVNNPFVVRSDQCLLIDSVLLSNDVYLFGYPNSLGALGNKKFFDFDKPLLRKGIVSYINRGNKTIILDCPVYPGNSGGPVYQVTYGEENIQYRLIGVVSQYIPFKQEWKNFRDRITNVEFLNSGYSVISAMDDVLDLIKKYE